MAREERMDGGSQPWAALRRYLAEHYERSVFDAAGAEGETYALHLHGGRRAVGRIVRAGRYDFVLAARDGGEERFRKLDVLFLYPARLAAEVGRRLRHDPGVAARGLGPVERVRQRHHVKNKTLFPFMQTRTVLRFTTLAGDVLQGLVTGIHRYELDLALKGGVPVTLMRHAVFDVRDKKGVSWLKAAVERRGVLAPRLSRRP